MAFAVIRTGGKQYRVAEGDTLDVELIDAEPGKTAEFGEVLLYSGDSGVKVGRPLLQGAKVTAEVLDKVKGDKVVAFKFRRRKGYHRTVGHRQKYTRVKITGIKA